MQNPFSLVIFDCDGVLVDSEALSTRVLAEVATELGCVISAEEALKSFKGARMADCIQFLSARLGRALPEDFEASYRSRAAEVFKMSLKPIPGVASVLDILPNLKCVASNGPREKILLTLTLGGLLLHFQDSIFSSYEVGSWKPEPGLFLHAAAAFGVPPASCAVVEDSMPGVQAGIAAGMSVFAYIEPAHAGEFRAMGAIPFHDMAELPALLARRGK